MRRKVTPSSAGNQRFSYQLRQNKLFQIPVPNRKRKQGIIGESERNMPASAKLLPVALGRTDVSEEGSTSIVRGTRIDVFIFAEYIGCKLLLTVFQVHRFMSP
jgi:hypothetical protein